VDNEPMQLKKKKRWKGHQGGGSLFENKDREFEYSMCYLGCLKIYYIESW
jgi:hypothetical protein